MKNMCTFVFIKYVMIKKKNTMSILLQLLGELTGTFLLNRKRNDEAIRKFEKNIAHRKK
jgi:hypothetical protein